MGSCYFRNGTTWSYIGFEANVTFFFFFFTATIADIYHETIKSKIKCKEFPAI